MTQTVQRDALVVPPDVPRDVHPAVLPDPFETLTPRAAPVRAQRLQRLRGRTLADLLVLGPLLALAGVLHGTNMLSSPSRIDDEGTYVAQAWAVLNLGELTHYTYWYDHPPIGWLQIAGYAGLTGAFDRAPNAVAAGRELMLVAALVSAALLWVLARRLRLPRWGAALAVVLFTVSPLAVEFHRYVYLDNLAVPWLLGAFVLAMSARRDLLSFTAATVCFVFAVLTKETTLLLLPVLAWLIWTRSVGGTRRYVVAVSGAVLTLGGLAYLAFALVKGEVVPGSGRVSVVEGIAFQLGGRDASGSVFTADSLGNTTVGTWLTLDPVLPVLAVVATVLALFVRRLRPFAVGMAVLLLVLLRPGYLPVPYVIAMLPFAALLVAGVAVAGTRIGVPPLTRVADRLQRARPRLTPVAAVVRRPLAGAVVSVGVIAVAVAATTWTAPLRSSLIAPLDTPLTQATRYVVDQVGPDERILTDDAIWVDLVRAGLPREDVVWYYKPDTDPAVPRGVENYSWVVSTDSLRGDVGSTATVTDAVQDGVPVAVFGTGDQRVEILRLPGPSGTGTASAVEDAAAVTSRQRAGAELAGNPRLQLSDDAGQVLAEGRVDVRLMTMLAAATSLQELQVGLPVVAGEDEAGQLRRTLVVTGVDGVPLTPDDPAATVLTDLLQAQDDRLAPEEVLVADTATGSQVRATWDLRPTAAVT